MLQSERSPIEAEISSPLQQKCTGITGINFRVLQNQLIFRKPLNKILANRCVSPLVFCCVSNMMKQDFICAFFNLKQGFPLFFFAANKSQKTTN